MRKLVPVQQVLDDAENHGINPAFMVIDPEDVALVDPDELDEMDEENNPLEENPDEGED